jgi:hypothetical protein
VKTSLPSIEQHFIGKAPEVKTIYNKLKRGVTRLGKWSEAPKKTSIHFNRKTAFAGIATRKEFLLLTIKANNDIPSPRIHLREQASANRWHLVTKLSRPSDVDAEILSWLRNAYELSA